MIEQTGFIRSPKDIRDFTFEPPRDVAYPDTLSLFNGVPMRVKAQGGIGSCTACALASAVEYFHFKQHGAYVAFSPGFIYGCRELTGRTEPGISFRDGLHTLRHYGTVPDKCFKLTEVPDVIERFNAYQDMASAYPNRISGYVKCETPEDIKWALMLGLPVVVAYRWRHPSSTHKSGAIKWGNSEPDLHAVICYGWDINGFKILNSWGKQWGDKGHAVIPCYELLVEAYALTDDIYDIESVHKPKRGAVRDLGYTVVNALIGLRRER